MSLKSTAQLTTDNTNDIDSAVNAESITPTLDAARRKDFIDSFYNKVDGIQLGTLTIPASLIGSFTSTPILEDFAQETINLLAQLVSNANFIPMDINAFRASKTVAQPIAGAGNVSLNFEDDTTTPNYDNGNHFFTDRYVSEGTTTRTFAVEKIKFTDASNSLSNTFRVRILKNGVEVTTTSSYTTSSSAKDAYGNSAAAGFTLPPCVAKDVTLVQGDVVTAEIVLAGSAFTGTQVEAQGVFSNT